MKSHAAKAFMLSAGVCPGAGHIYLQRKVFGITTIVITALCLVIPMWEFMKFIWVAQVSLDDESLSFIDVRNILVERLDNLPDSFYSSLYFFVLCWIASSLEAFRVGRMKDKAEALE